METYEQKYKKAIEIARNIYSAWESKDISTLTTIFSDLKENEDEKIVDELKGILAATIMPKSTKREIFNWLRKQEHSNTFDVPETSIEDAEEVTSRMQYINDDMKPIADFVMGYAKWNLHKDEWNQPTLTVPLFRVLDALILSGKPYGESVQNIEKQDEQKLNPVFDIEIPFGAKDSELQEASYYIPEGYHAEIDKNKVVIKREEEPINKVEPKFKVGDWIITPENKVLQITNIEGTSYRFNNESHYWEICYCDEQCRLWTIADAKDGDVLATPNYIYIFNSIVQETETVCFYCLMKRSDEHFSFGDYRIHDEILNSIPATKEQRDLLFQKMKEAGYEWDAEKEEVTMI